MSGHSGCEFSLTCTNCLRNLTEIHSLTNYKILLLPSLHFWLLCQSRLCFQKVRLSNWIQFLLLNSHLLRHNQNSNLQVFITLSVTLKIQTKCTAQKWCWPPFHSSWKTADVYEGAHVTPHPTPHRPSTCWFPPLLRSYLINSQVTVKLSVTAKVLLLFQSRSW